MPGPAASTIRMIERRWPENVESDCAIDCSSPMSAKTSRQIGRRLPGGGRDVQPGLVHQAEQPERAQRDGLAAGVRAGHDERRVAVAEPDVDRHDPPAEPGVAGRQQDDLGPLRGLGAGPVHVGGERRLGGPQVEPGERVERLAQRLGVGRDERRQLVEDARDLLGLGDLRLAPGVAELDRDERLDEQGLAAARRVVDDALDPAPGLGLDRHHVAAVAERDDRLLERAAELGADERVEPPAQPVVGHPDGRPQAAEPRRRRVEQLADRVEAARQRGAQGGQGMQLAAELAQQRPPLVGQRRRQPGGRVERLGDLEELGRVEPAAAGRALDRRPDVVGRPDPDARPLLDQAAGLVGLVERPRDDDRVARRLERLGQPPRRRERGGLRQPVADRGELEQDQRAGIHERCRLSRPETGRTATGGRARRTATGAPPTARRRRRSRSAAWSRSSGGASSDGAVSSRSGRCRVAQVDPGPGRVEPERRGDEAGPARQPQA